MHDLFEKGISYLRLASFYGGLLPPWRMLKGLAQIAFRGAVYFPVTVDVLVTGRCGLSCRMCSWKGGGEPDGRELDTEQIKLFIERIKRYRPLVHFGGGEPFLRDDMADIIDAVKRAGLRCLVTTSGFHLDEAVIKRVTASGIDGMIFSLYGWGRAHDRVTGVEGSFRETIASLRSALDKRRGGTRIYASTVPLPENIGALGDLVGNLRRAGVDGVKVEYLNFLTRSEAENWGTPGGFDLRPGTFVAEQAPGPAFAEDLLRERRRVLSAFGGFVMFKPRLNEAQIRKWYTGAPGGGKGCSFLAHSAVVNYNGDILPCQFLRGCVLGNIIEDDLGEVWRSARYAELRRILGRGEEAVCFRCCKT